MEDCCIAFVVLNYNDANTTIDMVDNLCKWKNTKLDMQIIIVDNRSTDDSFIVLKKHYTADERKVEVVLSEKNGGYSYGNNFGARYAMEHYNPQFIAIANPDIFVDEETMLKLLDTFCQNERVAMCSPVMRTLNGTFRIYSQTLPNWWDDLKACRLRDHSATLHYEGYQTLDSMRTMIVTEMLPGSFFVIRSSVFQEVGMLDEGTFLYGEERILGRKLKNAGYMAVLRSDLFFVHAHGSSISKAQSVLNSRKMLFNSRYYYQKNYEKCNVFQLIILKAAMTMHLMAFKCLLSVKKQS